MIRLPETQGMTKDGLSELVTEYWPDLRLRLGNLLDAFCETVQAGAAGHQLRSDLAVARFCSLCCALGPNFERKPENEWALAILADERLAENVKVHQLVVRASAELKARQGAGHGLGDEILRADGKLLDAQTLPVAPRRVIGCQCRACPAMLKRSIFGCLRSTGAGEVPVSGRQLAMGRGGAGKPLCPCDG
jgi:hypothetical protein